MASPLIPILVIIAVGAAVLLGKKKRDEMDLAAAPVPVPEPPVPEGTPPVWGPGDVGQPVPEPAPFPENYYDRFMTGYEAAVDECFAEIGGTGSSLEVWRVKVCALEALFPEAPWPPPANAHQWQRNCWHNQEFNDYVLRKWTPIP
jgi:hypothetical protein